MGNLQVTPLHRRHRREGAGLLRFWGVGEMSFRKNEWVFIFTNHSPLWREGTGRDGHWEKSSHSPVWKTAI